VALLVHIELLGATTTQAQNLVRPKSELAKGNVGRLEALRSEWPVVHRILVLIFIEMAAINLLLAPDAFIAIMIPFVTLRHRFAPLVHFNFSLQSVRVEGSQTKIIVSDLLVVDRLTNGVDQFKLVGIVGVLAVDRANDLAAMVHALGEGYDFLLIFPEEH